MKPASSAETATRTSAAGPTPRCSTKATRGWTWLHEAAARSTSCWTSAHRMKLVGCASANCGSSRVHSSSRLTFSVSPRPRPALGAPSGSCDSDHRAGPSGPSAAEREAHAAAEGAERARSATPPRAIMLIDALVTCVSLPGSPSLAEVSSSCLVAGRQASRPRPTDQDHDSGVVSHTHTTHPVTVTLWEGRRCAVRASAAPRAERLHSTSPPQRRDFFAARHPSPSPRSSSLARLVAPARPPLTAPSFLLRVADPTPAR